MASRLKMGIIMATHNKNVTQLTDQVQALRKQREQLIQQEIDHDIKRSNLKNIQSFFQTYQGGPISHQVGWGTGPPLDWKNHHLQKQNWIYFQGWWSDYSQNVS